MEIKNEFEKLFYATIGLAELGYEKAQKIIDEASKQGKEKAEACKVKNEELRCKMRAKFDEVFPSKEQDSVDELAKRIEKLSEEDKEKLSKILQK